MSLISNDSNDPQSISGWLARPCNSNNSFFFFLWFPIPLTAPLPLSWVSLPRLKQFVYVLVQARFLALLLLFTSWWHLDCVLCSSAQWGTYRLFLLIDWESVKLFNFCKISLLKIWPFPSCWLWFSPGLLLLVSVWVVLQVVNFWCFSLVILFYFFSVQRMQSEVNLYKWSSFCLFVTKILRGWEEVAIDSHSSICDCR